jgi:hypothetical protein
MSRVTAIPHLIPQTKMVKVMQALEKRAPRSTENIGGKEYKLRGSIYTAMDRKNSNGKDVTDIGYVGVCGTKQDNYGDTGRAPTLSVDDVVEFSKSKSVISADLPFIHSWTYLCLNIEDPFSEESTSTPSLHNRVDIGIYPFDARPFSYANMLNDSRLRIDEANIDQRRYTPLYSYTDTDKLIASVHIHKHTYSLYMTLEQKLKNPTPVSINQTNVNEFFLIQNMKGEMVFDCGVTPTIGWGGIDDRTKGIYKSAEQLKNITNFDYSVQINHPSEFIKNVSFNWFKLSYIFQ